MKIESSGCRVVTVSETDRLDAITIYLQDFTRKGRITVECYGKCWTTYFGAYGDGTLINFVAKADVGYLVNRFLPSNLGVKALKNEEIYLRRIVIAVKDALAQIIADCEASSDPLAVAVRLERAEAEVARLREALREIRDSIMACKGSVKLPLTESIRALAETALGKEQNG